MALRTPSLQQVPRFGHCRFGGPPDQQLGQSNFGHLRRAIERGILGQQLPVPRLGRGWVGVEVNVAKVLKRGPSLQRGFWVFQNAQPDRPCVFDVAG